jgi:uncharacterized membrane protein YciS (DUF1049 family)
VTSQQRVGDNSPQATGGNATINDRTGRVISLVAFAASFLALGLAIGAVIIAMMLFSQAKLDKADRERDVNSKLQVSENHWRDIEVKVKTLEERANVHR